MVFMGAVHIQVYLLPMLSTVTDVDTPLFYWKKDLVLRFIVENLGVIPSKEQI